MKLRLAGAERRHRHWAVAHLDETQIEAVLAEQAEILRHIDHPVALACRTGGHDDFIERRRRVNRSDHQVKDQAQDRRKPSYWHQDSLARGRATSGATTRTIFLAR